VLLKVGRHLPTEPVHTTQTLTRRGGMARPVSHRGTEMARARPDPARLARRAVRDLEPRRETRARADETRCGANGRADETPGA